MAYDYYHYDYYMDYYDNTATSCLEWCRNQKIAQPTKNFVACEYDGTYCNIYEDHIITGGNGDVGVLCWVFVAGTYSKISLNLLLALF